MMTDSKVIFFFDAESSRCHYGRDVSLGETGRGESSASRTSGEAIQSAEERTRRINEEVYTAERTNRATERQTTTGIWKKGVRDSQASICLLLGFGILDGSAASRRSRTRKDGKLRRIHPLIRMMLDSILQISLQDDLQSRSKKHEMQLSALKENLATVRTELRAANEKVAQVEQIKTEKAGKGMDRLRGSSVGWYVF